jgi:uncharacterized protein YfaS (alpha-2-macroglobulin family)
MDALGSHLQTVTAREQEKGTHQVDISLQSYPAGSYFVRIVSGRAVKTLKCIRID